MTLAPVPGQEPRPGRPVLLVVTGGAVTHTAIARAAELAAGAPVTVVGVRTSEISRTDAAFPHPGRPSPPPVAEPEQVRRTVALAMSVLESTGVIAMGHVAVTSCPARAVARVARARGARIVILDQPASPAQPAVPGMRPPGQGTAALVAELRRRMYGSGVVVLAAADHRSGWVKA
ncbi:MAG TPA: hypothetical protein VMI73_10610 [Trebonia sp.]|nr:hypothetical protein [Trebonia sp.]